MAVSILDGFDTSTALRAGQSRTTAGGGCATKTERLNTPKLASGLTNPAISAKADENYGDEKFTSS